MHAFLYCDLIKPAVFVTWRVNSAVQWKQTAVPSPETNVARPCNVNTVDAATSFFSTPNCSIILSRRSQFLSLSFIPRCAPCVCLYAQTDALVIPPSQHPAYRCASVCVRLSNIPAVFASHISFYETSRKQRLGLRFGAFCDDVQFAFCCSRGLLSHQHTSRQLGNALAFECHH